MDRKVLGANLKAMRKALKMSQEFVCSATGITQNSLSVIEGGTNGGLDTLILLLNYYGKYFDLNGFFSKDFVPVEYGKANPSSNVFEMKNKLEKIIIELKAIAE